MFENVEFFSHLRLKLAKIAIMTQKLLFMKIWVSQNTGFYADFKFVDADKHMPLKKL
jgi:hypothetical protein